MYERWWEGRKQLGQINAATRDIGRYCVSASSHSFLCFAVIVVKHSYEIWLSRPAFAGHFREDRELAEKLIRWTIAFMVAVKCTLRREHVSLFSIQESHEGYEVATIKGISCADICCRSWSIMRS